MLRTLSLLSVLILVSVSVAFAQKDGEAGNERCVVSVLDFQRSDHRQLELRLCGSTRYSADITDLGFPEPACANSGDFSDHHRDT